MEIRTPPLSLFRNKNAWIHSGGKGPTPPFLHVNGATTASYILQYGYHTNTFKPNYLVYSRGGWMKNYFAKIVTIFTTFLLHLHHHHHPTSYYVLQHFLVLERQSCGKRVRRIPNWHKKLLSRHNLLLPLLAVLLGASLLAAHSQNRQWCPYPYKPLKSKESDQAVENWRRIYTHHGHGTAYVCLALFAACLLCCRYETAGGHCAKKIVSTPPCIRQAVNRSEASNPVSGTPRYQTPVSHDKYTSKSPPTMNNLRYLVHCSYEHSFGRTQKKKLIKQTRRPCYFSVDVVNIYFL